MKKATIIYVLNKKGKPLMPTTRCGKVHKLLKKGKAIPVCNNPFTIRLKYETPDIVQSLTVGVDTGRENIGVAVSDDNGKCVYIAELFTSNKSIKKKMTERAAHRRSRRKHNRQSKQRKSKSDCTTIQSGNNDILRTKYHCKSIQVSYPGMHECITHKVIKGKEAKFNNRKRKEGWITPSARQLIQMHILLVKEISKFLPIDSIVMERVCFDFQKLANEDIKTWEYGKGRLYGYKDYKAYINDIQHRKCLICGKKDIEYYHHIIQRKNGGSDRVDNIVGLCYGCHYGPDGVHNCHETQQRLIDFKADLNQSYKVSLLNSVIPKLIEELADYCEQEHVRLYITDGKTTAETRYALQLSKEHYLDAYCISLLNKNANVKAVPNQIYTLQRFKKKSGNNISKLNRREYYLDGQLIAINRHKATDQKENSLEEFLFEYGQNHTKKEIEQLLHQIVIKPAVRTYTYHKYGRHCSYHTGDTIIYKKYNKIRGNTKAEVFICTGIKLPNDYNEARLCCGTKNKKIKFCKVLKSGCISCVNVLSI
jgi:hypothetical protein